MEHPSFMNLETNTLAYFCSDEGKKVCITSRPGRRQLVRPISAEASGGGCCAAVASSSSPESPFGNPAKKFSV